MQKRAEVTELISDKINFKFGKFTKDEVHCIIIQDSKQEEQGTI